MTAIAIRTSEQREANKRQSQQREIGQVSLLWPTEECRKQKWNLNIFAVNDLSIDRIVRAIDNRSGHERFVREILTSPSTSHKVIEYRQEIIGDLLADPYLTRSLQDLLPSLANLGKPCASSWPGESPLMPVILRLGELESYVECIDKLASALNTGANIQSSGLINLRSAVQVLVNDPQVISLRERLPQLHDVISETNSVTIGMNLGPDLNPESATIVDLNKFRYTGPRSLWGRLLGQSNDDSVAGKVPIERMKSGTLNKNSQLFKDLRALLESAAAPVSRELERYRDVNAGNLAKIEGELAFLTGAANMLRQLHKSGLPICRPEICKSGERCLRINDAGNVTLALQLISEHGGKPLSRQQFITNDISFEPNVSLIIITGPNRGGKTTYCRAVGQLQVLFQCGLWVTGSEARMRIVDGVWTHFPSLEGDQTGAGRLDLEIERLHEIFNYASPNSLVIMNEPLTSTSERDALQIASGVVRGLQLLGAHSILVTHLHELAQSIPELNESGPRNREVVSLVAETYEQGEDVKSTFHIVPGLPSGESHAMEIAKQHGLTYQQIEDLLDQRSLLGDD